MFKKLKDKLAEEVKSSPQRIQQFAQAAQTAVTSASSSISDITNTDLFSIGDNDGQQNRSGKPDMSPAINRSVFQDVSLAQPDSSQTSAESMDYGSNQDIIENQRQRRLSNSSFASDVSFRLPSYESPSMYHLQSDVEISASEAEERGFSGSTVSLDRVTKEQIYAAYRRTQERYTKYRTQYADLARHYKLLERENAKAKSVLVETQDKALRRISELREQCALEQSAKAHLEKALRVEIEEKNIKIDTLNTKIQLLQSNHENHTFNLDNNAIKNESEGQLINLSIDNENKPISEESSTTEVLTLSNKIEKLEQLINKYKDSLKITKEKNAQLTTEIQILSSELENKSKENEELKVSTIHLTKAQEQIQELNDQNEELQNRINSYDFTKTKEISTLETDLQKAQEEIEQLRGKIEVFTKREEEYAISLAENKLSIHKELESKENEIKSLKDSLAASKKEIQSLNIVINDYKTSLSALEEERSKFSNDINELNSNKSKIIELESQIQGLTQKCQSLEMLKTKADEEFKCFQLQLKQETAEKLAMIDRNTYLENRNTQLSEENAKKTSQIKNIDNELQALKKERQTTGDSDHIEKTKMLEDIEVWKSKYSSLESEIQEERVELVKLQTEIEKLLTNHEMIQIANTELQSVVANLKCENGILQNKILNRKKDYENLLDKVKDLQQIIYLTSQETKSLKESNNNIIPIVQENMDSLLKNILQVEDIEKLKARYDKMKIDYSVSQSEIKKKSEEFSKISEELNLLHLEIESLGEENTKLKSEIQTKETENSQINDELRHLRGEHEVTMSQLQLKKEQKQQLMEKIKELENRYQQLQVTLNSQNDQKNIVIRKAEALEQDNQNYNEKIKLIENENSLLNNETETLRQKSNETITKYNTLKEESDALIIKIKTIEDEKNKLQETIKVLTKENNSLKGQAEKITNSVKEMDSELSEVRKSHADIEKENSRLNSILEELENNARKNKLDTETISTQTDEYTNTNTIKRAQDGNTLFASEINLVGDEKTDNAIEVEVFKEENIQQSENMSQQNVDNERHTEILEKYLVLKDEYNLQKEENRRLESDVSGLQTYLAKISKENSVLNDKLRELIASSENSPHKNEDVSNDLTDLKNEIQVGKGKIDDLMRENTLLIDENLELKDQLNSQNYKAVSIKPPYNDDKDIEYINLTEKYKNLLEVKSNLEKRLSDLEQMNNSVNGNMLLMQHNNEKLRLSNEKLERRLDEALVSLRHLHSLQENTELEYLRNILYEYLTGSGTHSITLAKVLAAVVKFDDTQTQQVLVKERERQGFLRQLGLL